MHSPESYWHIPGLKFLDRPFCKCSAEDPIEGHSRLMLVTDPAAAREFWETNDFQEMAAWAKAGFPSPLMKEDGWIDVWILSPDPGKEIDGDS